MECARASAERILPRAERLCPPPFGGAYTAAGEHLYEMVHRRHCRADGDGVRIAAEADPNAFLFSRPQPVLIHARAAIFFYAYFRKGSAAVEPVAKLISHGFRRAGGLVRLRVGPRDMATDGHDGLLVEAGDVPALARSLATVIRDPDLRERLGRNALLTAQKYSLDRVMADWNRILETVFTRGPSFPRDPQSPAAVSA